MNRRVFDERALQFDVRQLDDGDEVEIFLDPATGWRRGWFLISSRGEALVKLRYGDSMSFAAALRLGIRRLIH